LKSVPVEVGENPVKKRITFILRKTSWRKEGKGFGENKGGG